MKAGKWLDDAKKNGLIGKTTGTNSSALSAGESSQRSCAPSAGVLDLISEKEWQELVVGFAEGHGWAVAHCRKVLVKNGKKTHWETAMPKGWFDLVLARDCLYFVELKVEPNVQEPEQKAWEKLMVACGQTCFLWYPRHWGVAQLVLSRAVQE